MSILDKLNSQQREAAEHKDGPLLILAGAGSGKTSAITHRAAYLIEQGVAPYNILAITFTNKAAKEMRARIDSLTACGGSVWVSTFHSMCVRILRAHINRMGFDTRFTIYDADDALRVIKRCARELELSDKQFPPKGIAACISGWKNELLSPKDVEGMGTDLRHTKFCAVYNLYQQKLRENNALDFDDLIFKTVMLFENYPDVLEQYQRRFQYIMVDEYQDTNLAQYRLVKLLAQKNQNICVVGDDDQSIYGWRGANVQNILDFEKDYKRCHVIKLMQNYRSTQVILDAANGVISHNRRRKAKQLWTDKYSGTPIFSFHAIDDKEEARFVAEKITSAVSEGKSYKDHAVLYRTNAQSRAIEELLLAKGVPYRLFGGVRFYERMEIRDIVAYLRVINNPRDGVSLTRIINVPRRGIGESTVDKLMAYAADNDMPLFDALSCAEQAGVLPRAKKLNEFVDIMQSLMDYSAKHSVTETIKRLLLDINYIGELMAEGTEEAMGRIENIEELSGKAAGFEEEAQDKSLAAFLEELALVADVDSYSEDDDTVSLMTLHSSKGLEFPCVFIVGMEEGVFPSYRSITSGDISDLEEERRLCYVGITRARQTLYITTAGARRRQGQTVYNPPSRFLQEIPEELMEQSSLQQEQHIIQQDADKEVIGFNCPKSQITEKERTGISQFAEVNKVKNAIDISFGGKNYSKQTPLKDPANVTLDFGVGDKVRQMKYGIGIVKDIRAAGADYEVTVNFENAGEKKIMAKLSKLKKAKA